MNDDDGHVDGGDDDDGDVYSDNRGENNHSPTRQMRVDFGIGE
jgi:hypothetical protein